MEDVQKQELLTILCQKGTFPYEIFKSHSAGIMKSYPNRASFTSLLKNATSVNEEY